MPPVLKTDRKRLTIQTANKLTLDFYAGQRSPMTSVTISIPEGINITPNNTTINIIGRGEVLLQDFSRQSIGRTGSNYSYNKVGKVQLLKSEGKDTKLIFQDLDLRPSNGPDIRLCIQEVTLPSQGEYQFTAQYTTSQPDSLQSPVSTASLEGVTKICDFTRDNLRTFTTLKERDFSSVSFHWTTPQKADAITLLQSEDMGETWKPAKAQISPDDNCGSVHHLTPNRLYAFKLQIKGGRNQGDSNWAWYYSGLWDVKTLGVKGDSITDDTNALNKAIEKLNSIGGGILHFPAALTMSVPYIF